VTRLVELLLFFALAFSKDDRFIEVIKFMLS
jgi:hypothetical protein